MTTKTTKKRAKKPLTERAITAFRDRIVGLVWADPSRIKKHPENWRGHPDTQKSFFADVLKEVGIADAIVAFILNDDDRAAMLALTTREERVAWLSDYKGKLMLIDGELRHGTIKQPIATLVLDVGPDEARKILATHDAVTALATAEKGNLVALAERASFGRDLSLALTVAESKHLSTKKPIKSLAEVHAIDVSDAPAEFFLSVKGPIPEQPDVLQKLRAALRKVPGVRVSLGIVGGT